VVDELNIGFQEDPKDDVGIIRARLTGGQLRSWEIPRTEKALEVFHVETGKLDFPGIYVLFHKKRLYVGEAKSLYNRIKEHMSNPKNEIKDWDKAYIISNGRPAEQSDLNDEVVRKTLEHHLINLFKTNKYTVVSQGEHQKHNPLQKVLASSLIRELNFFLQKKGVIQKLIEESGQEEVLLDELKMILIKKKMVIQHWGKYEATVNGDTAFIRPGSEKSKGWQITFRAGRLQALKEGKGYLLVARDGVPFVPLKEIQKIIDESAYEQDTVDIYVEFVETTAFLKYKDKKINITSYKLTK
jgi:hypothetical protein